MRAEVTIGGGSLQRSETSVPFSLKYVKDFYQPPFGGRRAAHRLSPRRL